MPGRVEGKVVFVASTQADLDENIAHHVSTKHDAVSGSAIPLPVDGGNLPL